MRLTNGIASTIWIWPASLARTRGSTLPHVSTAWSCAITSETETMTGAVDRRGLIAAILVGVIGPEVFIVQPGFVQGLVEHLGFDDRSAGYVASIEVWGITATTVLMTFFAHHFNWRKVITVSLVLVAISNLL